MDEQPAQSLKRMTIAITASATPEAQTAPRNAAQEEKAHAACDTLSAKTKCRRPFVIVPMHVIKEHTQQGTSPARASRGSS
jgi:hypothetical protein